MRFLSSHFLSLFNVSNYTAGNLNLQSLMIKLMTIYNQEFFTDYVLWPEEPTPMTIEEEELASTILAEENLKNTETNHVETDSPSKKENEIHGFEMAIEEGQCDETPEESPEKAATRISIHHQVEETLLNDKSNLGKMEMNQTNQEDDVVRDNANSIHKEKNGQGSAHNLTNEQGTIVGALNNDINEVVIPSEETKLPIISSLSPLSLNEKSPHSNSNDSNGLKVNGSPKSRKESPRDQEHSSEKKEKLENSKLSKDSKRSMEGERSSRRSKPDQAVGNLNDPNANKSTAEENSKGKSEQSRVLSEGSGHKREELIAQKVPFPSENPPKSELESRANKRSPQTQNEKDLKSTDKASSGNKQSGHDQKNEKGHSSSIQKKESVAVEESKSIPVNNFETGNSGKHSKKENDKSLKQTKDLTYDNPKENHGDHKPKRDKEYSRTDSRNCDPAKEFNFRDTSPDRNGKSSKYGRQKANNTETRYEKSSRDPRGYHRSPELDKSKTKYSRDSREGTNGHRSKELTKSYDRHSQKDFRDSKNGKNTDSKHN